MKNLKWSVLLVLSSMLILGGCGDKNKSGGSGTDSYWGGLNTGTYNGIPPVNTSNPFVQTVFQSVQCVNTGYGGGVVGSSQRMGSGIAYNSQIAFNGVYVGVTYEGDIAVLTGNGGTVPGGGGNSVLSIYLCPRPNVNSGQLVAPVAYAPTSRGCRVDQISAMNIAIPGLPQLTFFPVHLHSPQASQALGCGGY